MRRTIAITCVLAAATVWAGEAGAQEYAGKYKSKITSPDGDVSKASVVITKVEGKIYMAETTLGDFVETAICFAEPERLSCGFGPKPGSEGAGLYIGFSIYEPDGTGKLIGKWAETGLKRLGKEVLTPVVK